MFDDNPTGPGVRQLAEHAVAASGAANPTAWMIRWDMVLRDPVAQRVVSGLQDIYQRGDIAKQPRRDRRRYARLARQAIKMGVLVPAE